MLIGLLSDTHIPGHARQLPEKLFEIFKGVDLILHAGDVCTVGVIDELETIAPVQVALGNSDPAPVLLDRRVRRQHIMTADGVFIYISHKRPVDPYSEMVHGGRSPMIIVSGHTHVAGIENEDGILFVNPGSPVQPDHRPGKGTVALLHTDAGHPRAEIIQL